MSAALAQKGAPLSHTASAGKMTVLGLDGIRAMAGERWAKTSLSVHRFFEAKLQREMRPGDLFYRLDELSYLVVFRQLSLAEAQIKCVAIADQVCRLLFGEDAEGVRIRSVVGTVQDGMLINDVDIQEAVQSALECTGVALITTPEGTTPQASRANIHAAREAGVNAGRSEPSQQQLDFLYRPIWDGTLEAILTYLCQPLAAGMHSEALQLCTSSPDEAQLALDLMLLRQVTLRLGEVRKAGSRIRAGCPVHLSSIGPSRHWSEYSAAINAAPRELLADIVFVVTGIDETTPATRLFNEVPKLCSRAKSVFAAVPNRHALVARLANTGIHAVGTKLPGSLRNEQQTLTDLGSLAREARAIGAEAFVFGARSTAIVAGAIAAGVRYLEGDAIWPALTEPKHAFVHKLTELYDQREFIN